MKIKESILKSSLVSYLRGGSKWPYFYVIEFVSIIQERVGYHKGRASVDVFVGRTCLL